MTKSNDPLEPVPRYEFLEAQKEVRSAKTEADKVITTQVKRTDDLYTTLAKDYYTKDGVKDQFKIELSDYKAIKAILIVVGVATLGLVFAVLQQYIINTGGK